MDFLKTLNPEQKAAVTSEAKFQLVLAGAGSGKTRVLVNKIAWLMQAKSISPYQVLALTFTNKAAKNMRFQLENLLEMNMAGMWMGTFHGIAHRILRRHAEEIGLDPNFQIIDQKEQQQILKGIYKNFNISEAKWPINKVLHTIQTYKSNAIRAKDVNIDNFSQEQYAKIYNYYEQACQNSHLIDFTELLLKTLEVLESESHIAELYHEQFTHVMCDEFQDTNKLQFRLMQAITGSNTNIMAVGDDDQSIYSWRGASVEHMHQFSEQECEITRLEQNFRSTSIILNAANSLISKNNNRLGKNLWSNNDNDLPIENFTAYNDIDEANYVVSEIENLSIRGERLSEIAVLYRSNAQSRVLEENLNRAGIPYKIYGGLRFFDRMEIKDILGYLSLCVSSKNDAAFERIINKPARGIGAATINNIRAAAFNNDCSMLEAIPMASLSTRASKAINSFLELVNQIKVDIRSMQLSEAIDHIAHASGLIDLYQQDEPHQANARIENIQELMHAAEIYGDTGDSAIASFISELSLEPIETDDSGEQVQLMTVHSAKGLEFNNVFVTGLEEGLFPHQMSLQESGLEEERRLCYVAITRARQRLYLSHAQIRRLNGKTNSMRKSRFLGEMQACVESNISNKHFQLGSEVNHPKFGHGIIINAESDRLQISFRDCTKWILTEFLSK